MSVDIGSAFNGISYTGYYPPDTIAANSYDYVVEMVNATIRYYNKGGSQLYSNSLQSFFAPLGGVLSPSDPVVTFDNQTGQCVLGMLDYNTGQHLSRFDFAVSNDQNPLDGWTLQRYDMNDGVGGFEFADYPRLGYSADAWVVSCNMFLNGSSYNHVTTLTIDKASLVGYRTVVSGGSSNFTLFPVTMQDANPGDPAILVERGGSGILKLYQEVEGSAPTFWTNVSVGAYSNAPNATQPGGSPSVATLGDRLMSASMIYGQIMVAHSVFAGTGVAHARWYQIDTTLGTPYLFQSGDVDQGPGVSTFMPSIVMNYEGDIGITVMECSSSEYVSMYVTGESVNDWGSGTVQSPVDIFPGINHYTLSRAGDYSGITVDPSDGYTFWAANEYKGSSSWNTGIAQFGVSYPAVANQGRLPIALHHATQSQAVLVTARNQTQTTAGQPVTASGTVTVTALVDPQALGVAPGSSPAPLADSGYTGMPLTAVDAQVADGNWVGLVTDNNWNLDSVQASN
jgi:hypothetical protein